MHSDRAGSGHAPRKRGRVGVNLPAVNFSRDFRPSGIPPTPLDIDQLCAKAKSAGFIDAEADEASYLLGFMSYQHLSRYFDMLKVDNGTLPDNAELSTVNRLAVFDREYQSLLMKNIGLFELKFRAQYSYTLSLERGAFAHRNPKNFKNQDYFDRFLSDYSKEFNRQMRNRNTDVTRAYEMYGDAPVWTAVEIMSAGTLSMLYNNTRSPKVRNAVAASFGTTEEEFVSWTRAISSVRNVCAHFGKLLGSKLVSMPKRIPNVKADNSNPFYIVLLLIYLLRNCRLFADTSLDYLDYLIGDSLNLFGRNLDLLPYCGFPDDWLELIVSKPVAGRDFDIDWGESLKDPLPPGTRADIQFSATLEDGGSVVFVTR